MRSFPLRRATADRAPGLRPRHGVSLVEVLVAVTLLSISLLGLARISPLLSQYGRKNDVQLNRAYVLQQQADRLMAMNFTVLENTVPAGSTTATITVQGQTYRRSIVRLDSVGMHKITLIIKPLSVPTALQRADSLVFWRGRPSGCALNTSSC